MRVGGLLGGAAGPECVTPGRDDANAAISAGGLSRAVGWNTATRAAARAFTLLDLDAGLVGQQLDLKLSPDMSS